jgi:hypothetical protein
MQAKGAEKGRGQAELPKLVVYEVTYQETVIPKMVRFRRWYELEI